MSHFNRNSRIPPPFHRPQDSFNWTQNNQNQQQQRDQYREQSKRFRYDDNRDFNYRPSSSSHRPPPPRWHEHPDPSRYHQHPDSARQPGSSPSFADRRGPETFSNFRRHPPQNTSSPSRSGSRNSSRDRDLRPPSRIETSSRQSPRNDTFSSNRHSNNSSNSRQDEPSLRNQEPFLTLDDFIVKRKEPNHIRIEGSNKPSEELSGRQTEPSDRLEEPSSRWEESDHRQKEPIVRQDEPSGRLDEPSGRLEEPSGRLEEPRLRRKEPNAPQLNVREEVNTNRQKDLPSESSTMSVPINKGFEIPVAPVAPTTNIRNTLFPSANQSNKDTTPSTTTTSSSSQSRSSNSFLPPPQPSTSKAFKLPNPIMSSSRRAAPEPPRISDRISWEYPTPMVEGQSTKSSEFYPRPPPAPLIKNNDVDFTSFPSSSVGESDQDKFDRWDPPSGYQSVSLSSSSENTIPLMLIKDRNKAAAPVSILKNPIPLKLKPVESLSSSGNTKETHSLLPPPPPFSCPDTFSLSSSSSSSKNAPTFSAEDLEKEAEMWMSQDEDLPRAKSTSQEFQEETSPKSKESDSEDDDSENDEGSSPDNNSILKKVGAKVVHIMDRDHPAFNLKAPDLPEGWIRGFHHSGLPIYLHKPTRVVTWSRPYCIGTSLLKKHDIPVPSVPCLAFSSDNIGTENEKGIKFVDKKTMNEYCRERFALKGRVVQLSGKRKKRLTQSEKKELRLEKKIQSGNVFPYTFTFKDPRTNNEKKITLILNKGSTCSLVLNNVIIQAYPDNPLDCYKELFYSFCPANNENYWVTFALVNNTILARGVGSTKKGSVKCCCYNAIKGMAKDFPFKLIDTKNEEDVDETLRQFFQAVPLADCSLVIKFLHGTIKNGQVLKKMPLQLLASLLKVSESEIDINTIQDPNAGIYIAEIDVKRKRTMGKYAIDMDSSKNAKGVKDKYVKNAAALKMIQEMFPFMNTWWDAVKYWIDDIGNIAEREAEAELRRRSMKDVVQPGTSL